MAVDSSGTTVDRTGRRLWLLGTASLLIYGALLSLSFAFQPDEPEPPILRAVLLLAAATLAYFLGLGCVLRRAVAAENERRYLHIVVGFAVAYRVLLLPSWPIQEIDYYRYLWDGRVTLAGFNPYHYSPFQVGTVDLDRRPAAELVALRQMTRQMDTVQTIFERVHYRDVPTAYPPVAQAVFAGAALLTPAAAPLWLHVLVLKLLLVGFDLATLGIIIALLRHLCLPRPWCLAYAWCPLVLKEFANSGHFDAVAMFFSVLALYLLCRMVRPAEGSTGRAPLYLAVLGLAALGLGVLAKSYPIVLAPVVGAFIAARLGWRGCLPLLAAVAVVVAGYLPFCRPPDSAPSADEAPLSSPGTGLTAFMSQWEMNDLLFMLVRENVRPPRDDQPDRWFVILPDRSRTALYDQVLVPCAAAAGLPVKADLPLVLAQLVLALVLVGLCMRWAWQVYRRPEAPVLLRAAFLSLAWGWLLSAAQNPWYLLWCLPLMVFDGRWSWFLLTGLVLVYYLRFWMEQNDPSGTLDTFDYGLVWLEYLPFFVALAVESVWRSATIDLPTWRRAGSASPVFMEVANDH